MYLKKQFTANNHFFEIVVDGFHEYQPGRDTWLFTLAIDGTDVTSEYTSLPYLSKNLDKWEVLSVDSRYIFLPLEVGAMLIDTQSLEKHVLPTRQYRGNQFTSTRLFIFGRNLILLIDLKSIFSSFYFLGDDRRISDMKVLDDHALELSLLEDKDQIKDVILYTDEQTLIDKIKPV
ncbi:MAG: hypothetical protein ACK5MK_09075 [Dysgonomonas sp.]